MAEEVDYKVVREQLEVLAAENEMIKESFSDIILQMEDKGWQKLDGVDEVSGPRLEAVKTMSKLLRDVLAANTLIKKLVGIRSDFIWGYGVTYTTNNTSTRSSNVESVIKANKKFIFGSEAQLENERALSTDGNSFWLLSKQGTVKQYKITRIPITQMGGTVSAPGILEDVMMYRRVWDERVTDTVTGITDDKQQEMYYPSVDYVGAIPKTYKGIKVSSERIKHITVNKQSGWIYGVPDIFASNFWSRSYKETLEANYAIVQGLAKFIWKAKSPTAVGSQRAATNIVDSSRFPKGDTFGNSVSLGPENDLQAINKAGSAVSFNNAWPLAAMAASGLDIPLHYIIMEKPPTSDLPIPITTIRAIANRQDLWSDVFESIFEFFGIPKVVSVFPQLYADPPHRIIQAISVAASTNAMHPEEVREVLVEQFKRLGAKNLKDTLPEDGRWLEFSGGANDNPGTTPLNTPDPGGERSPAGPLADGDNEMQDSAN